MNPLESIYGGVVRARNGLYDNGTLKAQRLAGPVISIGNLSVGGAGKDRKSTRLNSSHRL